MVRFSLNVESNDFTSLDSTTFVLPPQGRMRLYLKLGKNTYAVRCSRFRTPTLKAEDAQHQPQQKEKSRQKKTIGMGLKSGLTQWKSET